MPFIHEHDLLFVHIPKTGGTSIEKKFHLEHSYSNCYRHDELLFPAKNTMFSPQHYTPDIIKDLYENWFNNYKKFTIVRNPYTRSISEYFFRNNVSTFNDDDFYIWICKFCITGYLSDHVLPQSDYFIGAEYDYVLKFESLNDDFKNMCVELGIDPELGHHNKSAVNCGNCVEKLSQKSIETINKKYTDDFTNFGYKFK
tara:strand:- start:318 stop:914 length:597 start_codon:yes stop_codon:yes gene_type:complete